jgi:hypothetical protein
MTDEEHLENTVPAIGDEEEEEEEAFDVFLPVGPTTGVAGATHVAHMRGNEPAFVDVLAGFVATGSDLSTRLREPLGAVDLDEVRLTLDGLGPARVESIEPIADDASTV